MSKSASLVRSRVAGGSIRRRILKAGYQFQYRGTICSCRGVDPSQDTESFIVVGVLLGKLRVAGGSIRSRILKVLGQPDAVLVLRVSCRGVDPSQDTESSLSVKNALSPISVAGGSIRRRILKDNERVSKVSH